MTSLFPDESIALGPAAHPRITETKPEAAVGPAASTPDLRHRAPAQSLILELAERRATAATTGPPKRGRKRPPITEDERSWFLGALGERKVAALLSALGPEFTVLHSVPVGKGDSDIDHVVIGPSGVFTINTKNHTGKKVWVGGRAMLINGHKVPHIRNAAFEARRAGKLLSAASGLTVPVTAVIVVVNVASLTIRHEPEADGVRLLVIRDSQLLGAVATRPEFSAAQVQQIVDAAIQPKTWHKSPVDDGDMSEHLAAFDGLVEDFTRREKSLSRRKLLWRLAAAFMPFVAIYAGLNLLLNVLAG
ncbi:nuclease-related domain-containing protein [Mycetocola zhujimingii]|uniref:nuclease-related domain-containing protein n=1 Tax=Mycetocola zhujimingii TaxID=2079792 RepID=UPI000D3C8039|nr:nuclease-related domain-containing protein [Mycetocola zhujimingii]AWB88091.1 NERD domain-containing protein [Mycetocola zhujimingii]